jgi:uncharacterized protein
MALVLICSPMLWACGTSAEAISPGNTYNPFPACEYTHKDIKPGEGVNLRIPMRDCVRLSTNVYAPAEQAETYPVVLIRTPYGKGNVGNFEVGPATLFTAAGFVTIVQDTRGRHESEGNHIVLVDEPFDTADTLAWLEQQAWFDGRVGVWGASYLGLSAIAAAVLRPDLVDAIHVSIMGSDWYKLASDHGVVRADGVRFAVATATSDDLNGLFDADSAIAREIRDFPLSEAAFRADATLANELVDLFIGHTERDLFWQELLDRDAFHQTDVPVHMMTGWFDFQWRNQVKDYMAIAGRRNAEDIYLHIGPWNHLLGYRDAHDYPFENYAPAFAGLLESIVFMERYVAGKDTFQNRPPVKYYDGGTGLWNEAQYLFPRNTVDWVLYPQGSTDGSCPHRLLATQGPAETTAYTYNPREQFEMPGSMTLFEGEMTFETEWCGRTDGVVFETEALTAPVEIAGEISLELTIRTDVVDTPFVGRLSLVDTDGTVYNMREGVMLLSHRDGDDKLAAYTPHMDVDLTVPITALRWTLKPGQKLRVGIASSNWPLLVPHPNTSGDWVKEANPVIARQTVLLGAGSRTRVRVPVVER